MSIWRDDRTFNNCGTGISFNTLQKNPNCTTEEYFQYLCETTIPKKMGKLINVTDRHKDILKECMLNIEKQKPAYLYNEVQLRNFVAVYGTNFKCYYDKYEECYCLSRKN